MPKKAIFADNNAFLNTDAQTANPDVSAPGQTPPLVQPPSVAIDPQKPVPKNMLILAVKILIALIVLFLVSGGAVLALRVWDPLWNPFRPKPQDVLNSMLVKTQNLKTVHSEAEIKLILPVPSQTMHLNGYFSGDSDFNDAALPKAKGKIDLSLTVENSPGNASTQIEFTSIGKQGYIKINDVNSQEFLSLMSSFGIDMKAIMGSWIALPSADQLQDATSQFGRLNADDQAAFYSKVAQMAKGAEIYSIKKQFDDEIIGNQKVYHYLISLDRGKLLKFILDVMSETVKREAQKNNQDPATMAFVMGAVKGVIAEFMNRIGDFDFHFYIGKKDSMLYRATMDKSINLSIFNNSLQGAISINLIFRNSRFNQPIAIETPAQFKKIEELLPAVPAVRTLVPTKKPSTGPGIKNNNVPSQYNPSYFSSSLLPALEKLFSR